MRRIVAIAALLVVGFVRPASAAYLAGAAKVDVTPPAFDAAADTAAFPACPPEVFTGPRLFALQEPYVDLDGSGFFNYSFDPDDPMFGQGADPFCDANGNGRYDGLYSAGGVDHLLEWVHDAVAARALAIGDGTRAVVIVSVPAIGLFENVTKRMRAPLTSSKVLVSEPSAGPSWACTVWTSVMSADAGRASARSRAPARGVISPWRAWRAWRPAGAGRASRTFGRLWT